MRHILFLLLALLAATCWSGPPRQATHPDHPSLVTTQDDAVVDAWRACAPEGLDASIDPTHPNRGSFEVGSLQLPATGSSSVHVGSYVAEEGGWACSGALSIPLDLSIPVACSVRPRTASLASAPPYGTSGAKPPRIGAALASLSHLSHIAGA